MEIGDGLLARSGRRADPPEPPVDCTLPAGCRRATQGANGSIAEIYHHESFAPAQQSRCLKWPRFKIANKQNCALSAFFSKKRLCIHVFLYYIYSYSYIYLIYKDLKAQ